MSTKNEVFFGAVKGVIISLIFTLISILVFALILKIFSLNNNVIKPINYVIKVTAVFLGTFIAVKEEKGILKGFII
ncbi:MAG: TIGR04086 family membrane protein, partial [Clostridia bacterium]|nr:TIGR04086 family membrane protein [Clostridia bacterium]